MISCPSLLMEAAAEGALGVLLPSLRGARTPGLISPRAPLGCRGLALGHRATYQEQSDQRKPSMFWRGRVFSFLKKRPTLISQFQASVCRFLSQLLTPGRAQGRHHQDEAIARQPLPLPPPPHSEGWEPGLCKADSVMSADRVQLCIT